MVAMPASAQAHSDQVSKSSWMWHNVGSSKQTSRLTFTVPVCKYTIRKNFVVNSRCDSHCLVVAASVLLGLYQGRTF